MERSANDLWTPPLCRAALLIGVALAALAPATSAGQSALVETYDGPTPTWRQPEQSGGARILFQQRERAERKGQPIGAERVRFACPAGYSGVFLHPIGRAPVLEEFRASLDLRAGATGAQLAVRVVFPRTASGPDGKPLTTLIRGDQRYSSPEQWSRLTVEQLPKLVKRQARILRAQANGPSIDERGAYVDSVALIVPGGPGGAEFVTDKLAVEGVLISASTAESDPGESAQPGSRVNSLGARKPATVVASSKGLTLDGKPLFPRVWSLKGEPLEVVHRLGFDAVALADAPTRALAEELERSGLRTIQPAPFDNGAGSAGDAPPLDSVLCWLLPGRVGASSLDTAGAEVARVRDSPLLAGRPLVATPRDSVGTWSRLVDVVALDAGNGRRPDRFPAGIAQTRPGTPAIARFHLTHASQSMDQLRAFAPDGKAAPWKPIDAVEAAVWRAIAAGARGVWFDSTDRLGGASADDRRMAAAIEKINLTLAIAEPWLTTGESVGVVYDIGRQPVAVIIERARTKLVIGIDTPAANEDRSKLVIPSVSETSLAFEMTPAGLLPVARRRTLGGVSIDSGLVAPGAFLLLTDDRVATRDIQARIAKLAQRAVKLEEELAMADLAEWQRVAAQSSRAARPDSASPVTQAAKQWISRSKAAQSGGDLLSAYRASSAARKLIRAARAEYRDRLTPREGLESSPLVMQPATWPDELRLRQLLRAMPRSSNLLPGGDFEDLEQLRRTGWRHTQMRGAQGAAEVEISADDPRHGGHCLTLRQSPAGDSSEPAAAWITSPVIPLPAGQLIEITGWVRLDGADRIGSFAVIDSLGGDELAITVDKPTPWRPFRILRRPSKPAKLQLSFLLRGGGRASVDAVMLRRIDLASPNQGRPAYETANRDADTPAAAGQNAAPVNQR